MGLHGFVHFEFCCSCDYLSLVALKAPFSNENGAFLWFHPGFSKSLAELGVNKLEEFSRKEVLTGHEENPAFFITVIEGGLLFIIIPPAALFGFPVVA